VSSLRDDGKTTNTDLWNVSSQGTAVVDWKEFKEEEEEESFQEQTRGQTQTGQLDIVHSLTGGDGQRLIANGTRSLFSTSCH